MQMTVNDRRKARCNSRSGHHPTCGVMCEKTSPFRLKEASKGLRQLERRLFPRNSVAYKLFHPVPALKNPGAILTGNNVLLYILLRFDRQFMIQIRIEIRPVPFTGSIVEVQHIHESPPLVSSGVCHSHWRTPPVLLGVASARGSIWTSLYPLEHQASPRFPYKRTPERPASRITSRNSLRT